MKRCAGGCASWPANGAGSAIGSAIGGVISCYRGKVSRRVGVNRKKLFRLYREERLTLRKRGGRKRAPGTRRPILVPDRASQHWLLDFVSEAMYDGQRVRVLCVVDDCTRQALATVVDRSMPGRRMTRELDELIRLRGRPNVIVSDNGTEMTSHAVLRWRQETGVGWHYIAPGKPSRTPLWKASTVGYVTSVSMRTCSATSRRPAGSSKHGG